ncbi:MAG: DUF2283 domain-containing protein [Pseudomonadota bacterium]
MRVSFDEKANAVYFSLTNNVDRAQVAESEEVRPGVILDLNDKGEVLGLEILNVKGRIPLDELKKVLVDVA